MKRHNCFESSGYLSLGFFLAYFEERDILSQEVHRKLTS